MSESQTSTDKNTPAILGQNTAGGVGIFGKGDAGVVGESSNFDGVFGVSHKNTAAGVSGHNETGGFGVIGIAKSGGRGVAGFSDSFQGVFGHSDTNAGVVGESAQFDGVFGVSHNPARPGISGHNLDANGKPNENGLAGFFNGHVDINGKLRLGGTDVGELLNDLFRSISSFQTQVSGLQSEISGLQAQVSSLEARI